MSAELVAVIAVILAAMAVAPPIARRFGIGTLLGYLFAGILLGPHVLRHVFTPYDAHEILELSEFGIVLLLFLIGLELRPKRLWAMRNAIFKLGGAQVLVTGLLLAAASVAMGLGWWIDHRRMSVSYGMWNEQITEAVKDVLQSAPFDPDTGQRKSNVEPRS